MPYVAGASEVARTLEKAKTAILGLIDPGESRTFDQVTANRELARYGDCTLMQAFDALVKEERLVKGEKGYALA